MLNNSTDINNTITSYLQRAYTVMVSNCININKKNNRLSPEHTENRKDHDNEVGNVGSGLGYAQKGGGVKLVFGIPTLPSTACYSALLWT